jgi:hypothetical protein
VQQLAAPEDAAEWRERGYRDVSDLPREELIALVQRLALLVEDYRAAAWDRAIPA